MSLKLNQKVTVPPGGYRYTQKETGERLTATTFPDLIDLVRKHRQANGLGGGDIESEIEDQLCQVLPAGWCKQETGAAYDSGVTDRITFEQVKAGTATLIDWFLSGRQKVNQDEASNRVRICSACHFNQKPQGCSACSMGVLHEMVNKITGGQSAPEDHRVDGCVVCGCSLKAKVWLPLETLQKHVSAETNARFPEWCWAKKK